MADELQVIGKIIVVIESSEKEFEFADFGLNFDSSSEEILKAVAPAILEKFGVNIEERDGEYIYTVKKVKDSGNVYIFPKSPAGVL